MKLSNAPYVIAYIHIHTYIHFPAAKLIYIFFSSSDLQYLSYIYELNTKTAYAHTHTCICNIGCTYIHMYSMFIASLLQLFLLFLSMYMHTYIHQLYMYLYAVTGFMFVLPGLTLKVFPLTNFLCYYCRIALLFFFACCCCYYWCFFFFVCFALVVHPPVAKAASAMAIFDNVFGVTQHKHTLTRTQPKNAHS